MVVAPYSLVYYKVVLARSYQALAAETILTAVNSQTGESYAPRLVNPRGRVLTFGHRVDARYPGAAAVIRHMNTTLLERLNHGMTTIINQSYANPVGSETN
jgi:hypothetical protein